MISGCLPFSLGPLSVQFSEKRRPSGVMISSRNVTREVAKLIQTQFTFVGDNERGPNITFERINLESSVALFLFTNLSEKLSFESINVTSTKIFLLCRLEVFAFPDQCGQPEIPINGTVDWQRGSPKATYSCVEGYALEPGKKTRTCQNGRWSGTQPICKPLPSDTAA